jgi:hypothetical protein
MRLAKVMTQHISIGQQSKFMNVDIFQLVLENRLKITGYSLQNKATCVVSTNEHYRIKIYPIQLSLLLQGVEAWPSG